MRTGVRRARYVVPLPLPLYGFSPFPPPIWHVAPGMWRMRYERRRETRVAFARLLRGCTAVVRFRAVRNGDYRFVSLLAQLLVTSCMVHLSTPT